MSLSESLVWLVWMFVYTVVGWVVMMTAIWIAIKLAIAIDSWFGARRRRP